MVLLIININLKNRALIGVIVLRWFIMVSDAK